MRGHKFDGGRGRHGRGRPHHAHHEGLERGGRFGRLLGHGDLREVILALLEKKPSHGYELIKALEELSSGIYSPSPGSIYPTLTYLEESGAAEATMHENKKLYTITKEGRARLDENREQVEAILERFSSAGERMSRLKHWMGRDEAEVIARGERSPIRKAMHVLKAELFRFVEAAQEQKKQAATIIERAAEELRSLKW